MESRPEPLVRSDWMFQVRSACQTFYNSALYADRTELERASACLGRAVPSAESLQEADALADRLEICANHAGRVFHQAYHRREPAKQCLLSPVESALHVWARRRDDPRAMFARWTAAFLAAFDAAHPSSPAERAAAILQARFRRPPALDELALESGASRSTLVRDFKRLYDMSQREYVTRVRLRWFIETVRQVGAIATRVAPDAGYESYHNLVDALRSRTGFTPDEIRLMAHDQACEIIWANLSLSRSNGRPAAGGDGAEAAAIARRARPSSACSAHPA